MANLDTDNFSRHLPLPEHLCTIFVILPNYTGESKEKWWQRLVTTFMGWSHSVTISHAIHEELLFSEASPSRKGTLKKKNPYTDLFSRFGWYTDDFFVLGTDKWRAMRIYNHIWGASEQTGLPPIPSKIKWPLKKEVKILGIEIDKNGEFE